MTVAQTYTHYLPCGAHRGREQAERERIDRYHSLGFKITTYFNPHVCTEYQPVYDEAAAQGLFVKNAAGEPYVLTNPFTADEQISEIDFTNPAGRALFGRLLDDAIDAGYDGWMEDFGEYTPVDSVFANGETGRTMHNRYPVALPRCVHRPHDRCVAATSPSTSAPASTASSPTRASSGAATRPRTGAARTASAPRCTSCSRSACRGSPTRARTSAASTRSSTRAPATS